MSFLPNAKVVKSGDRLTVLIRLAYHPRGLTYLIAFRWRIAGVFSLKELMQEEAKL
jgi:hypothetical protein